MPTKSEISQDVNRDIRFGPYSPPRVAVGDLVQCEWRGLIRVHSWRDGGAMMWPMGIREGQSPGAPSIVLIGDLVRAVKRESAIAITRHWGVSRKSVRLWRRALGVDRMTEGTTLLSADLGNMDIGQYAPLGNAASLEPAVRTVRDAHHAETMRNKPGQAALMGKLGRLSGWKQMEARTPSERSDFARIGGKAAAKRSPREKRASYLKKLKTEGNIFRYERLRDRFVTDARIDGLEPKIIADLLGIASGDVYQILYDLAGAYPVLAKQLLTERQQKKLSAVGDFAKRKI